MTKRKVRIEEPHEDAADAPSWSESTVAELKLQLESRGLSKTGRKSELIARIQASDDGQPAVAVPTPKQKRKKKEPSPDVSIEGPSASQAMQFQSVSQSGERRLRPFEAEPDELYKKKLKKIRKEKMFMLDRTKTVDRDGFASETFDIAGSTGNIYQTTICREPKCTCMDAKIRGQKCKHICYALIVILKAPAYLCYQTAFLSDELLSIFANAPVTRAAEGEQEGQTFDVGEDKSYAAKRKPIDGSCPICVFDMEPDEEIVWCKVSCGQNFHNECFEQWRKSRNGGQVTCVYCRAPWQEIGLSAPKQRPVPGSLASLKETAPKVKGYRNIGFHDMYK